MVFNRQVSSRHWPSLVHLAIALIVILGGLIAVLLWRWGIVGSWGETTFLPATIVNDERVDPRLSLRVLAGTPIATVARDALQGGDVHTAYALLLWDLDTPPVQRLDLWRLLLRAGGTSRKTQLAQARVLYTLAVLHPHLSDTSRLDILLYLLPHWRTWEVRPALQATTRSIQALINYSPALRLEQRQRALATLQAQGVTGGLTPSPLMDRPAPQGAYIFPTPLPTPKLPPDVLQAWERRRQAAATLAQNPRDPARVHALAEALRAEDLARETFYGHALASTITPREWVILAWDRVRWRTVRVMVAHRAWGLSILPAWEEQRRALQLAQIKAWEAMVARAADWMAAQPDIAQADQGTFELWSWVAWAGESGLYPRYPQPQVWDTLRHSQDRYYAHPEAPWRPWIDYLALKGEGWYALVPPPQ